LEQRQEYLDRVPANPEGDAPVGDFTATRRSGGSLSEQEFRTVSRGPDTSRSGPTRTQQQAYRGTSGSDSAFKLGPGEGYKVRKMDTPVDDLRRLDALERDLLDGTDAGPLALRSGASASGVGGTMLTQVDAGEGVSGVTMPATFGLGTSAGSELGLDAPVDSRSDVATAAETFQTIESDLGLESVEDTAPGADNDVGQAPGSDVGSRPGSDVGVQPVQDTTPGLDDAVGQTPDEGLGNQPGTGTPPWSPPGQVPTSTTPPNIPTTTTPPTTPPATPPTTTETPPASPPRFNYEDEEEEGFLVEEPGFESQRFENAIASAADFLF